VVGVQNLKKKHKRLEAELGQHEPAIQSVQEAGQKLMDVANIGVPEIESRLSALSQAWTELKQLCASRGDKLDQSLVYQQFLAKVEEEEAWISEKQQLLVVDDLGDSMAAVQVIYSSVNSILQDLLKSLQKNLHAFLPIFAYSFSKFAKNGTDFRKSSPNSRRFYQKFAKFCTYFSKVRQKWHRFLH
jgi:hypothetical protein